MPLTVLIHSQTGFHAALELVLPTSASDEPPLDLYFSHGGAKNKALLCEDENDYKEKFINYYDNIVMGYHAEKNHPYWGEFYSEQILSASDYETREKYIQKFRDWVSGQEEKPEEQVQGTKAWFEGNYEWFFNLPLEILPVRLKTLRESFQIPQSPPQLPNENKAKHSYLKRIRPYLIAYALEKNIPFEISGVAYASSQGEEKVGVKINEERLWDFCYKSWLNFLSPEESAEKDASYYAFFRDFQGHHNAYRDRKKYGQPYQVRLPLQEEGFTFGLNGKKIAAAISRHIAVSSEENGLDQSKAGEVKTASTEYSFFSYNCATAAINIMKEGLHSTMKSAYAKLKVILPDNLSLPFQSTLKTARKIRSDILQKTIAAEDVLLSNVSKIDQVLRLERMRLEDGIEGIRSSPFSRFRQESLVTKQKKLACLQAMHEILFPTEMTSVATAEKQPYWEPSSEAQKIYVALKGSASQQQNSLTDDSERNNKAESGRKNKPGTNATFLRLLTAKVNIEGNEENLWSILAEGAMRHKTSDNLENLARRINPKFKPPIEEISDHHSYSPFLRGV